MKHGINFDGKAFLCEVGQNAAITVATMIVANLAMSGIGKATEAIGQLKAKKKGIEVEFEEVNE